MTTSWPVRYRVAVQSASGEVTAYPVVTWLGRGKAEALARAAHGRRRPDDAGPCTVEVEEVGPAERTERGTVALAPDDVIDRLEF